MVSPAPPSNSTLSGNTTAARPCCLRMVKMCWRKLSCLLLVLAQKSSRLMMSDSLDVSPASLTMVTLLPLHVGGEAGPLLLIDQVHDEPAQLGRVLDFVL